MSNDFKNKYKDIHSEFITQFVKLHKYHTAFMNHSSSANGFATRKNLKEMIAIIKAMKRISTSVSKEHLKNVRDGIIAEKTEKARIKALPKKRGRPPTKGKINDNNTTN